MLREGLRERGGHSGGMRSAINCPPRAAVAAGSCRRKAAISASASASFRSASASFRVSRASLSFCAWSSCERTPLSRREGEEALCGQLDFLKFGKLPPLIAASPACSHLGTEEAESPLH